MLTLLRNATVYAAAARGKMDVLLADGRIAAIDSELPDLPTQIPHEVHDLSDLLMIPGLVDAHVHVSGGGGEARPECLCAKWLATSAAVPWAKSSD